MSGKFKNIATKVIHSGEPQPRIDGAVNVPIYQSAMFEYSGESSYHDLRYIRLNNTPNHHAVQDKLADLENAEAALVTASGMAAISTALLTFLSAGDHLLVQDCLYGGTYDLITKDFQGFGIEFDSIDAECPETWEAKLRPNTKAIYVETMTNPLLQVADLESVVKFARQNALVSLIDNTFASPCNFRAIEFGFDISLHSCTKYLNGHSDIVGGAPIGSALNIEKIRHKLNHLGGSMDPHVCFLLHRGIKTLAVRMKQHNESALKLAAFLKEHTKITTVNYPGLPEHRNYERAKNLFDGFSGMMSFEHKNGLEGAESFIKNVTLPVKAPSLGGVDTLVTRPALTSHAGLSPAERAVIGISDGLIRISVGIEATDDIIADFDNALQ
jgi:cystathionine beta-lyase/cystathionine gamma-synthase